MRNHLLRDLDTLNNDLLRMAVLAEENIQTGLKALVEKNLDLAEEAIQGDAAVDALENYLGERCAILLARQHPVGRDLRHLVGTLKVITDIERIADVAVHLGRRTKEFYGENYVSSLSAIVKMVKLGLEMFRGATSAFVRGDERLARETAAMDLTMDEYKRSIYRELTDEMVRTPSTIKQGTKMLFLSRLIERMGDHTVAICEWAIYVINGTREELR